MASTHNIADIRNNYSKQKLTENAVAKEPIEQFKSWLNEAIHSDADEPTAMVLATASPEGKPSARVVLLKGVTAQGFAFYTNYDSRKGQELAENPRAAITMFWPALERQVRIEGTVHKLDPQESDNYFHSRPKGSQIGAWASPQSQEIKDRSVLAKADEEYSQKFAEEKEIPRPPFWGGYRLQPERVEFWQGRPNRLHDRIVYERQGEQWVLKRLAP